MPDLSLVLALVLGSTLAPTANKPGLQPTQGQPQPQATQGGSASPQLEPASSSKPKLEKQSDHPPVEVGHAHGAPTVPEQFPPAGPPRLLDSALFDGGFANIDRGVLLSFGAAGRRYEVWEVQKNVAMDHALVLAFDAAGQELWRTKFQWASGEAWGKPLASTVDVAGDFYFMYVTAVSSSRYKWRIVKVTRAGAVAWQKTLYTTTWGKEPTFMAPHPQGGVALLSACNGQVRDLYTARISGAGDLLWESKYDVAGENNFPNALAVAGDGSIYIVGDDDGGMRVRKYAADGAIRWTSDFAAPSQYAKPKGRHAFFAPDGDLVVAGSTYNGGGDDFVFVRRYARGSGDLRLNFTAKLGPQEGKLSDGGLRGVYATVGGDGAVYFAWDDTDQLDSQWWLRRVTIPLGPADSGLDGVHTLGKVGQAKLAEPLLLGGGQVSWTKTFSGDAAMNVERLVWFPNGAIGVLGRGKRKLGNDWRGETRVRAVSPTGGDFGQARFGSPGDFHNEPIASALGPEAILHVLGWQYWHGDGWNDEDVLRLRFQLKYQPPPN